MIRNAFVLRRIKLPARRIPERILPSGLGRTDSAEFIEKSRDRTSDRVLYSAPWRTVPSTFSGSNCGSAGTSPTASSAGSPSTRGAPAPSGWGPPPAAASAGLLVALFPVLPLVALMLVRNHPLTAWETLALALMYGVTAFAVSTTLLIAIALVLRLRPQIVVDTPRALLGISFTASALLTAPIALWWTRFAAPPSWPELMVGLVLIVVFSLMVTVAVSAALLSFSIYELQRVPALHAKPRGVPMSIAATILIAILFLPTYFVQDTRASAAEPMQIVTRPAAARVALIAVDGLTLDVFRAHPALAGAFAG